MLGEFYTEVARHVCCWANSVVPWRSPCASWRAMAAPRCSRGPWPGLSALFVLGLWCWASFVAPTGRVVPASTFDDGGDGGFARHEAFLRRVAGVSDPHVVQFPQSGGGEVGTRGGAALKVRTVSEKSAEYGLLWATWSALWAHRGLS